MRITAEAKAATGQRILDAAVSLFFQVGWEATTTRQIAAGAGIATGTLFNYFPCKEAIAARLISDALEAAREDVEEQDSLEEELFCLIWSGFKRLRRYRGFLAPAAETIFSPLAQYAPERTGDSIRVQQLELVEGIAERHGIAAPLPSVSLQLYWTLYLGAFAWWTADASPNQEDTLALLDQSLKLFAASLRRDK